jgi:UDP-3-O-[3-hydroxymyristoyl] glucosamine N-acyltransferase
LAILVYFNEKNQGFFRRMKFDRPIPIKTIATQIGANQIIGDDTLNVLGINEIHQVRAGDITFSDVKKYFEKALNSAATFIILNDIPEIIPKQKVILIHPFPFDAYDSLMRLQRPFTPLSMDIAESAAIHPSVIFEPNVVIGNHVRIGAGTYIRANAVIDDFTVIGKNVVIGAGAIIGTDAFYFKRTPVVTEPDEDGLSNQEHDKNVKGLYRKWRSGGRVVIEDGVDIGSGCTINRGVSSDTIIGSGTKLDCQVHIGHDVVVGKNCLFAAQVGIGGNTTVEDEVVLYGQVGVAQNIKIGKKAIVLAKSGVSKSLSGDKTYFGYPAQEVKEAFKELAILRQLKNKGK